jgi:rRNA-processing protein FCF1
MEIHRIWNDTLNMSTESKHTRKTLRVILDSNAFFVPFQFKIDIREGLSAILSRSFEPIVLSSTLEELEILAQKGSLKIRKWATKAVQLAKECTFFEVAEKFEGSPDDAILEVAKRHGYPVFTNDRALRKRLRDINVPVIYVRQKSYLEIDGRI